MMCRGKETGDARRPGNPWLTGFAIGIAISSMATGAMMLGAGLAIAQAPIRRLPPR
jgi:hypothetical protein